MLDHWRQCHPIFIYFSQLIPNSGSVPIWLAVLAISASMMGATLARRVLEAMTDSNFRRWSRWIITTVGIFYLAQGAWLLISGWMNDP